MRRASYATGVEIGIVPADAFAGANSREERP